MSLATPEGRDLAAVANGYAVLLQLAHEIVRHRFAQVGTAVEQRHECPAPGQPDGRLPCRISAADHPDALGATQLGLGRAGRIEDADSLVLLEVLHWQSPV